MQDPAEKNIPLAERMRPKKLADFVGQNHLLGEDKLLWRLIRQNHMPSLLLWGPPGVGKTTLAHILAHQTKANFVFFSAVLSGIKEVRVIVARAEKLRDEKQQATILFFDVIHRLSKIQQEDKIMFYTVESNNKNNIEK